jgi:hypothetical protein
MKPHKASTIVALPLTVVQTRLQDVESWSQFLLGIESISRTGHERYAFKLADGRDHRELTVMVKLLPGTHCFVWRQVSERTWHGQLKLAPVDTRHTSITLSLASLPIDLRSAVAEWLPTPSTAAADLLLLEKCLLQASSKV